MPAFPALAGARADRGHDHHLRGRRLRRGGHHGAALAGLRVEIDLRNEKINYKVREHSLAKVPVILAVGKREAEEKTVTVRRLGSRRRLSAALTEEATPPDLAQRRPEVIAKPVLRRRFHCFPTIRRRSRW
jgi:histidyl-tRNA synthetase